MKRSVEELEADLENARGGMNTGDIEAAVAALESARLAVVVDAAESVVATAFGNIDGLSVESQLEALRMACAGLRCVLEEIK